MKKTIKSFFCIVLSAISTLFVVSSGFVAIAEESSNSFIDDVYGYQTALTGSLDFVRTQASELIVDSIGGEWALIGFVRGGRADNTWTDGYLNMLEQYIQNEAFFVDKQTGKVFLHSEKVTDNERVILALTALKIDATAFRGLNLVSALFDKDQRGDYKLAAQGINGVAFALIALDSGNYAQNAEGENLRKWCIDYLLSHEKAGGGWDLRGAADGDASADITAMILQAFAPYYKKDRAYRKDDIDACIKRAVDALKSLYADVDNGDTVRTSDGVSQIVIAFTALGYDGTDDESFLKEILENLLTYRDAQTGGFKHEPNGETDQMASEHAACALVAYDRYLNKAEPFYEMNIAAANSAAESAAADVDFSNGKTIVWIAIGVAVLMILIIIAYIIYKTKSVRIKAVLLAICIVAVLAGAFFLAPGTEKHNPTPSSSAKTNEDQSRNSPAVKGKDESFTCTISIRCDAILNNMNLLKPEKVSVLPKDGTILQTMTITFNEGESVFDVLKRVTREKRIQMEFKSTPIYNSAYIQGINNLYEFDCGPLSGWVYRVNGTFSKYGASQCTLKSGDIIEFVYTCDLGKDIGGDSAVEGG